MTRILSAALTCAFLASAPARAAAPEPRAEKAVRVVEDAGKAAAKFADDLAREYAFFLLRVSAELDAKGVKKPSHREAMTVPQANALGGRLISQFGAYASGVRAAWYDKAPAFGGVMSHLLDVEADRLAEFVRADPGLVQPELARAMKETGLGRIDFVAKSVAAATEKADSGPGLGKRLQRAQVVGDAEVARVVRRRVKQEAEVVGDGLTDAYLAFALSAEKTLDGEKLSNAAARKAVLGPQARDTAGKLLADFDRFAKAMGGAFAGSGKAAPEAAAAALKAERRRLEAFFETDTAVLRVEAARGKPREGRAVRHALEARADLERKQR
ncbi:MAG: hypothetical protein FD126_484 [Elusimicrobia bacterium]|nr:MAG: hypothetical protein FD126_484 [Elusimicrobiota bacterium]